MLKNYITQDQKKEIYNKYPTLFPDGEPVCGFGCGSGWLPLLTALFDKLSQTIGDFPIEPELKQISVEQVKEKFGGLRVYVSSISNKELSKLVHTTIAEAEVLSIKTCENCGSPGTIGGKGWIKTLCNDCKSNE